MPIKSFPHYTQLDAIDCGPACLRMIAKYYGHSYSLENLREKSYITREGVSMLGISDAAESIGFRTTGLRTTFDKLVSKKIPLPCILHWNQEHFVVLYSIKKRGQDYTFHISDPATGKYTLNKEELLKCWATSVHNGEDVGFLLMLAPTPDFYNREDDSSNQTRNLRHYFGYLRPYRSQIFQLIIGMLVGSLLALITPFLTQAMVDQGIGNHNLSFITLILISQLVLFVTQLGMGFLQNWITLHMNTRLNISLISDFLAKLMRLPIRFFDSKNIGDIMQRMDDPGVSIITTTLGGGYTTVDGTSFAAPMVAGVAALILSVNPTLTGQQVRNIIKSTANRNLPGVTFATTPGRPNGTWNNQVGHGLVDAYAAVREAVGLNPNISGPTTICGANTAATFTLQNIPPNTTIQWIVDTPLDIVGFNNLGRVVVRHQGWFATPATTSRIRAVIIFNGQVVHTAVHYVAVNRPTIHSIHVPPVINSGAPAIFSANHDGGSLSWSVSPDNGIFHCHITGGIKIPTPGPHILTAFSSGGCGTTTKSTTIVVVCAACGNSTFFPRCAHCFGGGIILPFEEEEKEEELSETEETES